MTSKRLHQLFAAVTFIIGFFTYALTVQPSVPFWDCGEFAAAGHSMQVPHPPGSPLFTIISRVAQMMPIAADYALRNNYVSVLAAAFTTLLAYLIAVKLIRSWRGNQESVSDSLVTYLGAFIAALAYNFCDTIWFNAVECEVYATGALGITLVIWIMMIWNEKAEEDHSERYVLLMAYIIGLTAGVHELSVLTVFSIMTIFYFRRYEFTWSGFLSMVVLAVLIFGMLVPFTLFWLPTLFSGNLPWKSAGKPIGGNSPIIVLLGIGILAFAAYGVYYSRRESKSILHIACMSFLLVFLGYSTYTSILIRSHTPNMPMNENQPKTMARLVSYLNREQYGDSGVFDRRYALKRGEPQNAVMKKYKSDADFMWNYQFYHMYVRYLMWNFVGRAGDAQNAPAVFLQSDKELVNWHGPSQGPVRFYAIPFLLGAFGMYWHFKKDWKRAMAFLAMFLVMGLMTAWVQNQQEPQPRERDYFYVGSFLVWALWIGIGAVGLVELAKERLGKKFSLAHTGGIMAACMIAPVLMGVNGWHMHDRSHDFYPFDYAYNILQSCERDAILFTYGDNDTFPLWYLQDGAGIRTDVRIVNLSLGNTMWYINELKNSTPHGALKVPISFSDKALEGSDEDPSNDVVRRTGQQPLRTEEIPVPREVMAQYTRDTSLINRGTMKMTWRGVQLRKGEDYYRVADLLVQEIVRNNQWKRPVYFAITAPGDAKCGLDPFLRMEGFVQRVTPAPQGSDAIDIAKTENAVMNEVSVAVDTPHAGFMIRSIGDPKNYAKIENREYSGNYRQLYLRLASYYLVEHRNPARSAEILHRMEDRISTKVIPMEYPNLSQVAQFYDYANDRDNARRVAKEALITLEDASHNPTAYEEYLVRRYPPQQYMLDMYILAGDYSEAKALLTQFRSQLRPNDQANAAGITLKEKEIATREAEERGERDKARAGYIELIAEMRASGQIMVAQAYEERLAKL